MQNKKSLLHRLLVIYITFFIILAISIAHSIVPHFNKGYNEGTELGNHIVKSWASGTPRMIYTLGNITLNDQEPIQIAGSNSATITARTKTMAMTVEQDAPGASVMGLAFSSIGGNPWYYLLTMINPLAYLAVIILMGIIIYSLRRSIREEGTLDKRNVWYLRAIGVLTIFMELLQGFLDWRISTKAAELLSASGYSVETAFQLSYSNIIMGILILFAAEVFAIGYNLSEEQKFTI